MSTKSQTRQQLREQMKSVTREKVDQIIKDKGDPCLVEFIKMCRNNAVRVNYLSDVDMKDLLKDTFGESEGWKSFPHDEVPFNQIGVLQLVSRKQMMVFGVSDKGEMECFPQPKQTNENHLFCFAKQFMEENSIEQYITWKVEDLITRGRVTLDEMKSASGLRFTFNDDAKKYQLEVD